MKAFCIVISTIIYAAIAFSSCNTAKMVSKSTHKKYKKMGTQFKSIQNDSSTIYLRQIDRGKPVVVLIHGFGPLPGYQWKKVAAELSEDFTVIVPDMVYFGQSTSNQNEFDPYFQASQIFKSIHNLGYEEYFVCGLSYGGLVASIMAHRYAENIQGLILVDALSKFSSRDYTDSIALSMGVSSAEKLLLPQDGKGMKRLIQASYYKTPPIPAFMYNKPAKVLYNEQRLQKEGMAYYLSDHFGNLQKSDFHFAGPVCIIWGREDMLIPIRNAYELEDYYENAEIPRILEKTGHSANMESPQEVAEKISEFVSKHS